MNFQGWVAIPRNVLDHPHSGRLTSSEQLVLLTLILLADRRDGSGKINAAALRTYLPDMTYDTSKRALKGLEDKRFLYRQIVHASKKLYRFWVHGCPVSDGSDRLRWTNLSQVFVSGDVNAIRYDEAAPDAPSETTPEAPWDDASDTTPDGPLNNNTETETETNKKKDIPFGLVAKCASDSSVIAIQLTPDVRTKCSIGSRRSAENVPAIFPDVCRDGSANGSAKVPCKAGLRWDKDARSWFDIGTNDTVPVHEVRERVKLAGLELYGDVFITTDGDVVPWDEALRRIAE